MAVERDFLADLSFVIGVLVLGIAGLHGLLRRRRPWLVWLAGAVWIGLPLLVVVGTGYRYAVGSARLTWPSGRPRYRELHNLDPQYRAFVEPGWREPIWQRWSADIQQHTLIWLIQQWGPMRGSYSGQYPEREQVRARLLEMRDRVRAGTLASSLAIGDQTVQLAAPVLEHTLVDANHGERAMGGPEIDVALVAPHCLVLGYWSHRAYHAELIDLAGFGWFAHYVYFEDDAPLPAQR